MMLALGLEKARERGIGRALVTCNDDNLPSAATIEACGGVLENIVLEEGKPLRRYWIDLLPHKKERLGLAAWALFRIFTASLSPAPPGGWCR